MTINLGVPQTDSELKPRITVVGVGGAGCNAVNNMIGLNLEGVEFIAMNTDAQSLAQSKAPVTVQLGLSITQGLGAGSRPDIGRAAAEEAIDHIVGHVSGAHMLFIAAGMGGGTGTGAAPVIARAAREQGLLTVGVVTKPFHFEGTHRMRLAEGGIEDLQQFVDTLIVIPNQNLFRVANEKTTFADAFAMADNVLYSGVRGITDLMVMPGLINLDFNDIRTVMSEMGKAMMGTGEAEGERRATEAAEAAISNPLLDDVSMKGARGVLINITGGMDMTLYEVDEAANRIREEVDPEANIIFGSTFDAAMEGKLRVSVVATGIDAEAGRRPDSFSLPAARPMARPAPLTTPAPAARPVAAMVARAADAEPADAPLPFETPAADTAAPMPAGAEMSVEAMPAPEAGTPVATPRIEPIMGSAAGKGGDAGMRPGAGLPQAPMPTPAHARVDEKPFIPPKAMEPANPVRTQATAQADPFAEAALLNGNREPERPRRAGLFGIIGSKPKPNDAPARVEPTMADAPAQGAVPATPLPAPAGSPARPGAGTEALPLTAGRLGGVERPMAKTSEHEDDLLDIPAFLRRQAN